MIYSKEWEKPELIIISGIETSENVLEWTSGGPPKEPTTGTGQPT
jgi:hypothetical protein